MQTLAYVLARLSEPSSYAGLGAILALAGIHFSDGTLGQLAQFLAAGCGLAALFLKERGLIQMIVLAAMLSAALGACAPLAGAGAAIGTGITVANNVAGDVNSTIQTACAAYDKGEAAASAVVGTGLLSSDIAGKVGIIEEYGDAACANPPSGDALSTAIWLGTLVGQIGTLTSVTSTTPAT